MAKRKEDKVIQYMENLKVKKKNKLGAGAVLNAEMAALMGGIDIKKLKRLQEHLKKTGFIKTERQVRGTQKIKRKPKK